MLQAIGLMMAGYIFVRLLEICSKPDSAFSSLYWKWTANTFAVLGMIGTVLIALYLLLFAKSPL